VRVAALPLFWDESRRGIVTAQGRSVGFVELSGESGLNAVNHREPVTRSGLAEEAHGGVPGSVDAVLEPSPIGGEGKHEPDGKAERAGEMGGRVVDGDDLVECGDLGGEAVDVGELIDGAVDVDWRARGRGLLFEIVEVAVLE